MSILSRSSSTRLLAIIAGTIALLALIALAAPLGSSVAHRTPMPPESPNAIPRVGTVLMVGIAGVGIAAMLLLVVKELTDRRS